MFYSMTGYGRASSILDSKTIQVEIRSLNGKQLDINARLPQVYREKEMLLRKAISKSLLRGKVDLFITTEDLGDTTSYTINKSLIKAYLADLTHIEQELNLNKNHLLEAAMRLPNATMPNKEALSDVEWKALENALSQAIEACMAYRLQEGQVLAKDIEQRVLGIQTYLQEVEKLAPLRSEKVREKLEKSIKDMSSVENMDRDRFEQELIYYLEKFDVTEEIVRLGSHCAYFLKELKSTERKTKGKKLNFISQEMGREINTIGSKANDATIQTLIVNMKDELEKIKEQMMNIL